MALECGIMFGKTTSTDKAFMLKYQPDEQSDLTTQRLRLMRNIAAKILSLHGHTLSTGENCTGRYMFTSKSEGLVDEGYEKYVCGVVKNSQSNLKEINLTWEQYIKCKMDQLAELSEHKFIESEKNDAKDFFLRNLANAIVIFELVAVKPSRSVIIGNNNFQDDRSITNTKGIFYISELLIVSKVNFFLIRIPIIIFICLIKNNFIIILKMFNIASILFDKYARHTYKIKNCK